MVGFDLNHLGKNLLRVKKPWVIQPDIRRPIPHEIWLILDLYSLHYLTHSVAYISGEEKEEQKVCKFLCGDAHLFPAGYRRRWGNEGPCSEEQALRVHQDTRGSNLRLLQGRKRQKEDSRRHRIFAPSPAHWIPRSHLVRNNWPKTFLKWNRLSLMGKIILVSAGHG